MTKAAFFDAIRPMFGGAMSQGQVDGINAILAATGGVPITHRAYMLATAKHETADTMQPIYERGNISYFNKYEPGTPIGKRLGNTQKGDGYRYRGRGLVQITGRNNYLKFGIADTPDKALNPATSISIMMRGMGSGIFTGKKLSDYLPDDYVNARRVVNGTDDAELIAGYARRFEAALRLIEAEKPVTVSPAPATAGWFMRLLRAIFGKNSA